MTTPPLSPAAQAVLDAAHRQPFMDADGRPNFAGAITAALRASVDNPPNVKVPTINIPEGTNSIEDIAFTVAGAVAQATSQAFIDHFLTIAAELGGEGEG